MPGFRTWLLRTFALFEHVQLLGTSLETITGPVAGCGGHGKGGGGIACCLVPGKTFEND